MKFLFTAKDGGNDSTVFGYWLVEAKSLLSVALIEFRNGSREAFHSHAFNSISWVLNGQLEEHSLYSTKVKTYTRSLRPIVTRRHTFHKVVSNGTTLVLTLRGPWSKTWREYLPAEQRFVTLAHGRQLVKEA